VEPHGLLTPRAIRHVRCGASPCVSGVRRDQSSSKPPMVGRRRRIPFRPSHRRMGKHGVVAFQGFHGAEREREREETHRPLRSTYSTSHVADCVHTSRVLHARLHCKSLRPTPARLRSERCSGGPWSARGRSYSDGERPNTTRASVRSDEMERGRSYIQYMGSTCGDRPRTRGRPCSRVLRVIV
jgi:hypothetical protein